MAMKPWQVALCVVSFLVLGGSLAWMLLGGKKVHTKDQLVLVDVSTGDRFQLNVAGHRAALIPEKNPETGAYSLLPVVEHDDGSWRVTGRAFSDLEAMEVDKSAVVDPSTGLIRISERPIQRISR